MELKTLKIKNLALAIGVAIFVLILVKSGCSNTKTSRFSVSQNQVYRKTLENKLHVPFRRFPRDILTRLCNCTETTLAQYNEADKTGWSTKVYDSYKQFKGKTEF